MFINNRNRKNNRNIHCVTIANTILMIYQITGSLYTGPLDMPLRITITINLVLIPLMGIGNVMCMF